MAERLWDSMTLGPNSKRLAALLMLSVLGACSSREVIVEGRFPTPVVDPVPVSVGVFFPTAFREQELVDDATGRGEVSWRVSTGVAQVDFWSTLLTGLFQNVVFIESAEDLDAYDVDTVLIPEVTDIQYAIPLYTKVKVYEIWMRYNFTLVNAETLKDDDKGVLTVAEAQPLVEWGLTAYGKTPTAFLQSDVDAVNQAAVMALRDAGANFITRFGSVPGIPEWVATAQQAQ